MNEHDEHKQERDGDYHDEVTITWIGDGVSEVPISHVNAQMEAISNVSVKVTTEYLRGTISEKDMQEYMAMIKEGTEAINEAWMELQSTVEYIDEDLTEALDAATTRARVRPFLRTDDNAQGGIILRELREMGYPKAVLGGISQEGEVTKSRVSYGAAPDWIVSELAGVVRVHQSPPTAIGCSKRFEDDNWDVCVEVPTSIDEDKSDAPFEGLGALFG